MCPRDRHLYCGAKRVIDFAGAVVLLILLSPLLVIVAVAVAAALGRPVLFTQQRPGARGEVFTILKFRTMRDEDPSRGLLTDAERLTRFGRILRSTSLDELPGLINVIRGEMSFVGPRPLLVRYLDRYDDEQARRHHVRPGVTGLAQTRGRNAASWADRLRWDVEYVDRHSLRLDLAIIWRTVLVVARRSGVSAPGHATVDEFRGDREVAA
ncbi:UDP-galactose phosphate transferase [Frondihabitans sp. PAMC 28766]|uniref:sugar transferase n=1 Tax=Frondihabitans sp. PAMC 28766 TaxID=1795630 RepID=UPI00078D50CA|nr:sugar transferase [Frondihabitans sp. PAMC 28766]AMM19179.1 UDP-galactose phosphate transferase [Frondihabitans sp. PAMC 28766]